jgi:hypothetical protein
MYIRLCEGFKYIDKKGIEQYSLDAQLVKSMEEAQAIAKKKPNSDWYYSTYIYNDQHKKHFDEIITTKNGYTKERKSVMGITDVRTSAL